MSRVQRPASRVQRPESSVQNPASRVQRPTLASRVQESRYAVKWSLSLHYRKKLNIFTPQLLIYYIQYENRKSRLEQMPEAATWGVLRKKMFFKMSQNSQETSVPEETPVNFSKFLRTPLSQNNSRRLLLKRRHFNNEARDIDCICCRELDTLLYCFG